MAHGLMHKECVTSSTALAAEMGGCVSNVLAPKAHHPHGPRQQDWLPSLVRRQGRTGQSPPKPRKQCPVLADLPQGGSRFLGQDEGILHELIQRGPGGHCIVHVCGCQGVILLIAYHCGGQRVEAQQVGDDASCSSVEHKH